MAKKGRILCITALVIVAIVAFAAGSRINTNSVPIIREIGNALLVPTSDYISMEGFEQANVTIEGTFVRIISGCYEIGFDVTSDQAYSIQRAMEGVMGARPLTHDIMKDILDNFNISVRALRIERFGDEIYYARMFLQSGNSILDIDARPSDTIALSLRTGSTLYVNRTMMKEKGSSVCE